MATYCNGQVITIEYNPYPSSKKKHGSKPNWSNINNGAKNILFMNSRELQQHFKETTARAERFMAIYEKYGFD